MKCTIKKLAEELNLSRNTVAKALKNSEEVSITTRKKVFTKAKELHYHGLPENLLDETFDTTAPSMNNGSILFLTKTYAADSEFWTTVLKGIEAILSKKGYHLLIGIMTENDLKNLEFPPSLNDSNVKGIIMVEICNDHVCEALLQYHLPIVTIDMPRNYNQFVGKIDIITMENKKNIFAITEHLIQKGAERFSFIGDIFSSNVGHGFQERYEALCECLEKHHLSLDSNCSMIHETSEELRIFQFIIKKLQEMVSLPDVFICGNDWTAIQLMYALQFLGYKIPKDVCVVGFDNIPASEHIIPSLTTINTPKEYLGIAAARQIIERIDHPYAPCVYAQYATELIQRNTTI